MIEENPDLKTARRLAGRLEAMLPNLAANAGDWTEFNDVIQLTKRLRDRCDHVFRVGGLRGAQIFNRQSSIENQQEAA